MANNVATIVEQIGYTDKETITSLRTLKPFIMKNDAENDVGTIQEKLFLERNL